MRITCLILAVVLISGCGTAESPQLIDAEASASLDAVLHNAVDDGTVPGVVALVTDRDSVIYSGAFGVMDAAGEEPMREDALFRFYSMTKPVTSVAMMMLVEGGSVGLDDPAADYLPVLEGRDVLVGVNASDSSVITRPAARPISVRDLFRHTSGIGYNFASPELLEWSQVTGLPVLDQPLLHDPGEHWTYGASTYFLGRIIEEVTGESISEALTSRVLQPLGMNNTSFTLAGEDQGRLVDLYRRQDSGLQGVPSGDTYQPMIRGDGGLLSTGADYARFMRLILRDGEYYEVRLLNSTSVSAMREDQLGELGLTVSEQPGAIPATSNAFPLGAGRDGFGLGFQIDAPDNPSARAQGSLSWAGLWNTHFWIDPTEGIGAVLLTQVLPFYDDGVIDLLTTFEQTLYSELR